MPKRAIVTGINYSATPHYRLNGCQQDAHNLVNLLLANGYDNSNIRLLLEPTKQRILDNLNWIVNNSVARDTIFLSYSGHGSQVNDQNKDEGKDAYTVFVALTEGIPHPYVWPSNDNELPIPQEYPGVDQDGQILETQVRTAVDQKFERLLSPAVLHESRMKLAGSIPKGGVRVNWDK